MSDIKLHYRLQAIHYPTPCWHLSDRKRTLSSRACSGLKTK